MIYRSEYYECEPPYVQHPFDKLQNTLFDIPHLLVWLFFVRGNKVLPEVRGTIYCMFLRSSDFKPAVNQTAGGLALGIHQL